MFGKLNRLRINTPEVRLPSTPAASIATPRDYFVDGPIGVYQRFAADGTVDQAIIFVGMRRGGRLLYAFDVTNPSAPRCSGRRPAPSCPLLGQTWSEPKVARIKGNTNPVLVLRRGLRRRRRGSRARRARRRWATRSTCSTPSPATCCAAFATDAQRSGRRLGDRLRLRRLHRPRLRRSISAARCTASISRSAPATAPTAWTMYTLADLSGGTGTGRKFFFGPDVDRDARLHGADARLGRPREAAARRTRSDHFFEIFDRNLGKGAPGDATRPTTFGDLVAAGADLEHHRTRAATSSSSRARRS